MIVKAYFYPLFVAALGSVWASGAAAAGLKVKTLAGVPSTLVEQLKINRHTVVMIWTTYCGVCKRDYPVLSAFHNAHVGRDAEVLGVSLDGYAELAAVQAFVAKGAFSFPTVIAEAEDMAQGFEKATGEKFTGTPTYLVFDQHRALVGARSGDITRDALETYLRNQSRPQ
ncbi:MAG: TlpA family protein disulfide reductase [Gammaproteobacteria bacterium]|nr:TlpA family protein disulfide reductase [Gammaproteobacteria bacterium]